ncbi:MAG: hypothetical protein V3V88_04415 [Dehalococcoidia bacterium]
MKQLCTTLWYRCKERKGGYCLISDMLVPMGMRSFVVEMMENGKVIRKTPIFNHSVCEYRGKEA